MKTPLILGIDGGGTKTLCVACNLEGEIMGVGTSGPSNHQAIPWEEAANALVAAIDGSLTNCSRDSVVSVCGGMAGVDWPGSEKPIIHLLHNLFPQAKVMAVPDVTIALHSVIEELPGAIIISGTGTMGYGEDASGQEFRASGWGYLLGDEGSGYDIGRRGLQAATQAFDGRGPDTRLVEYACQYFAVDDLRHILDIVYGQSWSPDRAGDFTPYVVRAAYEDDGVSHRLLEEAGEDLARTALSVLEQMHSLKDPITVGLLGGVFAHAGSILHDRFGEVLKSGAPQAKVVHSDCHPVLGALIMAYRRYNGDQEEIFRQRAVDELHRRL